MADATLTTNRRQFLSAAAIAPVAMAIPAMAYANPSAQWDAAVARYEVAKAAETRFERNVWVPADEASAHNHTLVSPAVAEEMDRLTNEADDRLWDVLHTAAPDRSALRWKLEYLLKDDGNNSATGWGRQHLAQTFADIARLLGDA